MIHDRRTGRGKSAGAPAHLPVPPSAADRISEDELQLVRHLIDEHLQAKALAEQTERSIEAATRHLLKKYGLVGADSINLTTGAITHVPAAGPAPGPASADPPSAGRAAPARTS